MKCRYVSDTFQKTGLIDFTTNRVDQVEQINDYSVPWQNRHNAYQQASILEHLFQQGQIETHSSLETN